MSLSNLPNPQRSYGISITMCSNNNTTSVAICNKNHISNIVPEIEANCATDKFVNQAAGSTRCAKSGCDNWRVANSRYCKDRESLLLLLPPTQNLGQTHTKL